MDVYKGVEGIEKLRQKCRRKVETLMQRAMTDVALMIIEASVVGSSHYNSKKGVFINHDPGQFKNSWNVTYNEGERVIRSGAGDQGAAGTEAYASARLASNQYQMQEVVYIKNSTPQAKYIEKQGWKASEQPIRETYGWEDKPAFAPVKTNAALAKNLLENAIKAALAVA